MSRACGILCRDEEQTFNLGQRIGRLARPNDCVALVGSLGAGKTRLVKGIADGLGVCDPRTVVSPTFVIINEYEGRLHLFHIDVYRLGGAAELAALGFEELCTAGGVVAIEWAERVEELLPPDHLRIEMEIVDYSTRNLQLRTAGSGCDHLLMPETSGHETSKRT